MSTLDIDANVDQLDPLAAVLEWDEGTAYDLLISIRALFLPKDYGLPAPWAAGVRKKLSTAGQHNLKQFFSPTLASTAYLPVHLVLEMAAPKNCERFLAFVEGIPGEDFMRRVYAPAPFIRPGNNVVERALDGSKMSEADVDEYRKAAGRTPLGMPTAAEVRRMFDDMADPEATKQRWLATMGEYYAVFFAQEEKRLGPALHSMLVGAQALAKTTTVPDLIERLSNGFTLRPDIDVKRVVLVPSVWGHPYVLHLQLPDHGLFIAWGAHPQGYRLAPGESVPEEAMLVLRALGDPTRLRLMRLIAQEPRSLQSLAQELKLSLPTVSHHIRELRSSGLIRQEVGGRGRESNYTVRWPSVERTFQQLERFVLRGEEK